VANPQKAAIRIAAAGARRLKLRNREAPGITRVSVVADEVLFVRSARFGCRCVPSWRRYSGNEDSPFGKVITIGA